MEKLRTALGSDRVSTRMIDRLAFAHDASFYRLVPQAIVRPTTHEHIEQILRWCNETGTSCTFRTGGTSISGQSVTDGIIVDLSREWQGVTIAPDASTVTMQPGITGARVNAMLHRYGRKIGPDPASIIAAMIGGIVANNSSGMCCGTAQNSYHTLESMQYMLSTGTMLDTAHANADDVLHECEPHVHAGLLALRDEVRSNDDLVATIRRKYRIKNTIGYSLNAFLDEDQPARILARLLVGSEGTLGFIASVTLRTVPDAAIKHTGLIIYPTLEEACADVAVWRDAGAAAVEIMDDASLRSFAHLDTTPEKYRITTPGVAALLVEFHDCVPPADIVRNVEWTSDPAQQRTLWKLRKGLMPTVGAMRKAGQTMINEDIAAPPEHLAALVRDVQQAFVEYDYPDGLIFGHAKDGNIHFIMNQSFAEQHEVQRYANFMDRIAEIVVDTYHGSLKAEHGTGRNMSPFVAHEWGQGAFAIMQRVKQLLDPQNILNRDVLINTDATAHISNLKPVPAFAGDEEHTTNLCIECGFCEHVCPTRTSSLTPRQRIVLQREMVITDDPALRAELMRDYASDGIDTCAVDSFCSTVCPVGIDTGAMVKRQRAEARKVLRPLGHVAARNMHIVRMLMRGMLRLGAGKLARGSHLLRGSRVPDEIVTNDTNSNTFDILYVRTCVSQSMQRASSATSLQQSVYNLAKKSGLVIKTLTKTSGCCGQPLSSQGFLDAASTSMDILLDDISRALDGRSIPVLLDASTCASALVQRAKERGITVIDQVGFAELVLEKLTPTPTDTPLVIHPGCGAAKLGTTERFEAIARKLSTNVVVPPSATCCGMGGSHGLQHPGIVHQALSAERNEVYNSCNPSEAIGISCNPMCEAALSNAIGMEFVGIVGMVERMTDDR
jgi:D-lactate dehydrogenase